MRTFKNIRAISIQYVVFVTQVPRDGGDLVTRAQKDDGFVRDE